jgi:RNA polymerase sigma-32 factor
MSRKQLMTYTQSLSVPGGSLDSYIQTVHEIPVLTTEEEKAVAQRLQNNNDLNSARTLVMHNLRFVIKVARGYNGYGLPLGDLIQEGNVGLMKAVKRFDPTMNVRLISFAIHWIRAEIHEYILRNWKIVKVATTKAQRKLFFNLRSSKKRLGWFSHQQVQEVAADLGVTSKDVLEMEKRMNGTDISFDLPAGHDDDSTYSPSQYLTNTTAVTDPAVTLERQDWDEHTQSHLQTALATLDERSKDIIASRWLCDKKATLQTLAAKYNISAERVRQLENAAIHKIKASVAAN